MLNNIETELKLRLNNPIYCYSILNSDLLKQLGSVSKIETKTLISTYYDTANRNLNTNELAFRLRFDGSVWTSTVKANGTSNGGLHQRAEWNVPVCDNTADITPFSSTAIGEKLHELIEDKPLVPLFITSFERQTINLAMPDGTTIELYMDSGEITAGSRSQAILELELELVEGSSHILLEVGATLAKHFPLLPYDKSKYLRGLILAELPHNISSVEATKISPEATLSAVLSSTITDHVLAVISAQEHFLESVNIENFHMFYSTVQNLKAMEFFWSPIFSIDDTEDQAQFDKLISLSSNLYNINCQIAFWSKYQKQSHIIMSSQPVLPTLLNKACDEELQKINTVLTSGSGRRLP